MLQCRLQQRRWNGDVRVVRLKLRRRLCSKDWKALWFDVDELAVQVYGHHHQHCPDRKERGYLEVEKVHRHQAGDYDGA